MDGLSGLIQGLQQTPARARSVLRQLVIVLDDAVQHRSEDQYQSIALDELPAVGARLLASCGWVEATPGYLSLPLGSDMNKLQDAREDIALLLQKADRAMATQQGLPVVPQHLVRDGKIAAKALLQAAEVVALNVMKPPVVCNADGLAAAKVEKRQPRGDEKPVDKNQPLEVPQAVKVAAAAISKSAANHPRPTLRPKETPRNNTLLEANVAVPFRSTYAPQPAPARTREVNPAGGQSVWVSAPAGVSAESRLVVDLPTDEFTYIERPWAHFLTRWAGIDMELERMFGDTPFTLIDLGSCNGFFSLQAAAGYPQATVLGVEGSIGVGNGVTGVDGTEQQIIETKAIQTHLRHIERLQLANCHIAPEVWTYNRICGLAALGRPISDAMLSLSVVHHIDNVSAEQYEAEGLTRVQGTVQLMAKLLCLSPRHIVELPDRPWIEHVHDAFGSHRAFLEAAAMASGRCWKFGGPLVQSIWYGRRELWLMEEVGAPGRGGALPFQGLKALFPRVLSMQPRRPPVQQPYMPVGHGNRQGQQFGYPADGVRQPMLAQQPPARQPAYGQPNPSAMAYQPGPMTPEELGAALLAAPTALIAAHVQLREAAATASVLLRDMQDREPGGPAT
eukprot:TRINITY_DN20469_c0_g1_i1.p1 TRINITY_DN20469_c0_g1~~TRINITY_DN20469_c0_g1_i1.p1  ORF type:complete len:620 (+),score=115.15 TRINITY_DN20469_c0_g1_i1:76-1935(+)